jgi:succinate-semialdehyde dehydrogenase/glutarate-semialdehyde dehydrogenase
VLTEVTPDMLVFKEETFGPLIAIMRFQSIEEGIALANQSPYGLASYAFTENLTTAYKIIDQLQYGIIGLNDGLPSTPQASFGGIKNSGFGREGGPSGLREYLVEKFVSLIV